MPERPTFAVVIPTYNRAERLLRTLDTVFRQEEPAAEVIVVDDCSTDETQTVVQELAATHPELRYIRHSVNQERAVSRNTGMSNATADYVTFLDSDDLMYPQNLREAADFAVDTRARFFHNLFHSVDEAGNHLRNFPAPRLGNRLRALALGNFPSCIGVFLHREIYTAYRFDTDPVLISSEDYELWLRVMVDYPIQRIPRVNSAFVHHEGRSMVNQDLQTAEKRIEYILGKVRSDPHLQPAYARYLSRMYAGRMTFLASLAHDNRQSAAALGYLRRAVARYPIITFYPRFVRCLQLAILNAIRGRGRVPECDRA